MSDSKAQQPASPLINKDSIDEIFDDCILAITEYTDKGGDVVTDYDRILLNRPRAKQQIIDLINREVVAARIDEVNKMPSPAYIGANGIRLEPIAEYKNHRLRELNQRKSEDE